MEIGFIGIGQMGRHMSRHVLESGYSLRVYDIRKEATDPLLAKGAKWADSPKDVAESCGVTLASLPGPPAVEELVYGPKGLMAGWKKGDIFVDMSTNSPATIRRIAKDAKAKGVDVLDAPVSGGVKGAEAGTLSIIVGGDAPTLEKVRKILECMGKNISHMGDVGSGNAAKLINNMITGTSNAIISELMVLGVKAGIDADKLVNMLKVSSSRSLIMDYLCPLILRGDFEPYFTIALACKDYGLAVAMGKEFGVPLPIASAVEQRFIEAKAAGFGEKGNQSLILLSEERAGVKVRSKEQR